MPQSTLMLLNYVYLHVSHMTCMEDASVFWNVVSPAHTCRIIYMYIHTRTHTHMYIYIYIYIAKKETLLTDKELKLL